MATGVPNNDDARGNGSVSAGERHMADDDAAVGNLTLPPVTPDQKNDFAFWEACVECALL